MAFNFFKKKKKKEGAHEHYHSLTVTEVVKETADAISIVFAQPEPKFEYKSGQFLTLIIDINGKSVRRAYSLSSSPYTDEDLAVTIKRVEGGLMSNFLNDTIKAGDTINVMEPMGHFTTEFNPANKRHIIMFGGGSGITPLMSHAKSALTQEPNSIVSLIYANRDIDSIIFKEAFQDLAIKYEGRFRVIHILDNAPLEWQGPSGLLNHEMLTDLFERIPNWGIGQTTYIMCGPEGMMNNVETLLEKQNIPGDKVFKESFVAGTINKEDGGEASSEIQERTVTILYDDEEFKVKVSPKKAILDAALDMEIDLPYSCQSGLCTACRGKCVSGSVKMDEEEGLSKAEIEAGYVLPCVSHPLTDDVKIEIG
ncbi:MAG: ferredoxin--NADP reductase [Cyclobacteriaceae bacterium]|nr:ferredoxin--NADP reductase [Cyclobacteriaceae bacterium]